jgi:hypothetical protein
VNDTRRAQLDLVMTVIRTIGALLGAIISAATLWKVFHL